MGLPRVDPWIYHFSLSWVDPWMNFQNFDNFSKILLEVMNFTDPSPQMLLHIIILMITEKK